MSIEAPQGILNIPNATLRVGRLEINEVVGADTALNTIARNTILLVDDVAYHENKNWSLKLPNAWAGEFECNTASAGNYSEFNFYNEGASSNAQGYNLTFNDTAVQLRYDGTLLKTGTLASTITGTGVKKVRLMFERTILSVTVDGTLVFTHDDTDGPRPRVYSTTAGGFLNFFTDGGALKNLKIVNEKWMSDGTSNIAYVGGGEVAVGQALAFNRVSNVSQIKVDSNVVTEYTGPHDRPLRKYPEVAMTTNSSGGYVASASSTINDDGVAYPSFAGDDGTTSWTSRNFSFDTNDPYEALNTASLFDGQRGEWIQLQLPRAIKVSYFKIIPRSTAAGTNAAPEDQTKRGSLYGSNDGTNFTKLVDYGDLDYGGATGQNVQFINVNATDHYRYLRLLCTARYGNYNNQQWVGVGELEYYGHEEGSGSLDTTLKSVYNVPATTGTQLEVYYDAKDLTTMPSAVTDLAGGDQNGVVTGVTLDTTNEAFVFNGSSYLETDIPHITTGQQPFTMSFWFKVNVHDGGQWNYLAQLGVGTASGQSTLVGLKNDLIGITVWGDSQIISDFIPLPGVWYHVTSTWPGGAFYDTAKLYINAVTYGDTNGPGRDETSPLSFPTSGNKLTLGKQMNTTSDYFNGSIANFRLYSKALNADQVKELYDYQKDYFLGSKSQVTLYKGHLGVGVTEPSGQLELAGDERIQEYPPRALRQYTTHVEGHGVFTVRASAELNQTGDNDRAWKMFTKIADDSNYWTPTGGTTTYGYSSSDGYTTAYHETAGVKGHWVQLQLPYKIKLHSVKIAAGISTRQAKDATVFGSNDGGNTWTSVGGWTDNNVGDFTLVTFSMNNVGYYSLYRLVITRNGGNDAITLSELQFFGTPGPTTLDKGSLTLGRSLDVPRISRYDVDTETPRPEKLVVDYDTTVNSSPTDISGKGNHGTFNGTNMNYSSADKAFVFNGADDYIEADTGFSGNQSHTVSLWVKPDIVDANFRTVSYISTTSGTFARAFFYYHSTIGTVIDFNNKYVLSSTLPVVGKWMHLLYTYSSNGDTKLYMDGLLKTNITESNPSSTITLNGIVKIGAGINTGGDPIRFLDGQISNFKLYNVALEPSEVKKLYRLGRTGRSMVISDTAVGIGKVPEAQLDVRGNIRCDGIVKPYTCAFSAYVSSGGNSSATDKFPADGVHFNIGNCYDASTYEFTAPVYGIYHMSWSGYTNESATTTSRIFAHQSGNLIEQKGHTIERHGNSLSLTVRMQAGETFYFRGTVSYPIYYYGADGHNRFSGHLICAL